VVTLRREMAEVSAETRGKILAQWRVSKKEYDKMWSSGNQRAYTRFKDSFVDAASTRWGIPKGDVRRMVEGPK
jgi:hypothetical protein